LFLFIFLLSFLFKIFPISKLYVIFLAGRKNH